MAAFFAWQPQMEQNVTDIGKERITGRNTEIQYNIRHANQEQKKESSKSTETKHCAGCDNQLFSSNTKYDSGSGWPAFYDALDKIKSKNNEDPLKIFNTAISNVKPNLECRSRRVGGATYQVPVEVKAKRGQALALRWLMDATRKRKNKTMAEKLYAEILDASQNKGSAIKKREDTHKMAESNKAFAHFRW